MAMTAKEERLIDLLKQYPHPNHVGEDYTGCIFCISVKATENGWTDEFINICEDNPDTQFDDILALIFTDERFPPLEIVDDE